MMLEQNARESRSSPRKIKYSKQVYSRYTLAEFADTIQHPVIDVTVVADITTPLPESLRSRVLDLLDPSFDAITHLSILPILSTPCEASDIRLECLKYRSFLCGFYMYPDTRLQQQLQLCILGIEEPSNFSAALRECVTSYQLFYPGMRACLARLRGGRIGEEHDASDGRGCEKGGGSRRACHAGCGHGGGFGCR